MNKIFFIVTLLMGSVVAQGYSQHEVFVDFTVMPEREYTDIIPYVGEVGYMYQVYNKSSIGLGLSYTSASFDGPGFWSGTGFFNHSFRTTGAAGIISACLRLEQEIWRFSLTGFVGAGKPISLPSHSTLVVTNDRLEPPINYREDIPVQMTAPWHRTVGGSIAFDVIKSRAWTLALSSRIVYHDAEELTSYELLRQPQQYAEELDRVDLSRNPGWTTKMVFSIGLRATYDLSYEGEN